MEVFAHLQYTGLQCFTYCYFFSLSNIHKLIKFPRYFRICPSFVCLCITCSLVEGDTTLLAEVAVCRDSPELMLAPDRGMLVSHISSSCITVLDAMCMSGWYKSFSRKTLSLNAFCNFSTCLHLINLH